MTSDQLSFYYQILGLKIGASEKEIKKAYRARAKSLHPDINKSADANAKFLSLNKAYNILLAHSKGEQIPKNIHSSKENYYTQHYDDWIREKRERQQEEQRIRAEAFELKRRAFRGNPWYYPMLVSIYIAAGSCIITGIAVLFASFYAVYRTHIIMVFAISPVICLGVFLIKSTLDWFKESKRRF
jgi:hypothetical protein